MRTKAFSKLALAVLTMFLLTGLDLSTKKTFAYVWRECDGNDIAWESDEGARCEGCPDTMLISTISFPPASVQNGQLRAAMNSWTSIDRSPAQFFFAPDSGATYGIFNGDNEVVRDGIDGPGGTLAVTRLVYNDGWGQCVWLDDANIDETDVVFDSAENWSVSSFNYTSTAFHFQTVAVHEFGHVMGLDHEDSLLARMNSFYPHGGPAGPLRSVIPLADDREGLRHLYPGSGVARPDLVGSNYKRIGSGTSRTVTVPQSAARGSDVAVEFTLMNAGSGSSARFDIDFYLSTDSAITASDRFLGSTTTTGAAGPGSMGTVTWTLRLPADVTPGIYFIGFVLDRRRLVAESNESNNSLAMWRPIAIF